jgi:pimeloyl-ACP methyl ester carboxylesterase
MRTRELINDEMNEFAVECRHRGQDVRLAVKFRRTSADLVVLLHGIGCSKESFDAAFTAPELDKYSICALDLPGHGESSRGLPREQYTLSSYAVVTRIFISQLPTNAGHFMMVDNKDDFYRTLSESLVADAAVEY